MELIISLINYVSGFFDAIWMFLTDTLSQMAQDVLAWGIIKFTAAAISIKIWAVSFAWGTAQSIIDQLGVSDLVDTYLAQLNPNMAYIGSQFGVFEGLNIMANAIVTRFVLNTTFLGSV